MARLGKGRKKVSISKRRNGPSKKDNELAVTCGAEVGDIPSSPGNLSPPPRIEDELSAQMRRNMEGYARLNLLQRQVDCAKRIGNRLDDERKELEKEYWFAGPIKEMNLAQASTLREALRELGAQVKKQLDAGSSNGGTAMSPTIN